MSEPMTFEGSCLCQTVHYEAVGALSAMYFCHCSLCRKETGSAHCANIFLKGGELSWKAGGDNLRRYALPGSRKSRQFCLTCGCPVPRQSGELVIIPAGSLTEAPELRADAHIYCDSAAQWEDVDGALPRRAEFRE
jgi:hypothetical protein